MKHWALVFVSTGLVLALLAGCGGSTETVSVDPAGNCAARGQETRPSACVELISGRPSAT